MLGWLAVFASAPLLLSPLVAQVARRGPADLPFATTVRVERDATTVYVSGIVPDVVDEVRGADRPARWGDTETQARSVFRKLAQALGEQGMTLSDIVMLRVYLVAPPTMTRMDYAGFSRAYAEVFGARVRLEKPARATLQVQGLVNPAHLIEIEATAARSAAHGIAARRSASCAQTKRRGVPTR